MEGEKDKHFLLNVATDSLELPPKFYPIQLSTTHICFAFSSGLKEIFIPCVCAHKLSPFSGLV